MSCSVQFDGLDEADWISESDGVDSARSHSGSTADAIGATPTVGTSAAGLDGGARRGWRGHDTGDLTRDGWITATSSGRIGPGAWGITLPET